MEQGIDVTVDVLTRSIVNVITGDVFNTEVLAIGSSDVKHLRSGWRFNWLKEMRLHSTYKLVIAGNLEVIQGLVSITLKEDHVFINLIESANFNIGANKVYEGVGGNLFAFACKRSFDAGLDGFVVFHAKSNLVRHYREKLGAERIGNSLVMVIETDPARRLVDTYFSGRNR
jgi:hypothetical protein